MKKLFVSSYLAVLVSLMTMSMLLASQSVRLDTNDVSDPSVTAPQIISFSSPIYTDEARRQGIEGSVIVQVQFESNGDFKVLRVTKRLGYGLDANALSALAKWRFSPAMRNGQSISTVAEVEVPFRLNEKQRFERLVERALQDAEEFKKEQVRKQSQSRN